MIIRACQAFQVHFSAMYVISRGLSICGVASCQWDWLKTSRLLSLQCLTGVGRSRVLMRLGPQIMPGIEFVEIGWCLSLLDIL